MEELNQASEKLNKLTDKDVSAMIQSAVMFEYQTTIFMMVGNMITKQVKFVLYLLKNIYQVDMFLRTMVSGKTAKSLLP
jgi:hypothetical protein